MSEAMKPRLIVVAGPNGAGKTPITEQLLRHEWMGGCEYVNPDYIARDEYGDWNAPDAVRRAADRGADMRDAVLAAPAASAASRRRSIETCSHAHAWEQDDNQ